MRWIVTGGSGFIGSNLCKRLLDAGEDVFVFDPKRPRISVRRWNEQCIEHVVHRKAWQHADVIVNLAALSGIADCEGDKVRAWATNVYGVFNIVEVAGITPKTGAKLIHASSGAVLAKHRAPLHPDMRPVPTSFYGMTKTVAEQIVTWAGGVSLRLSNVYGPYSERKQSAVHRFVRNAMAGDPIRVVGDGTQTRDFVHVSDVVDAIVRAAQRDWKGDILHVGSGVETSVTRLANTVRSALGSESEVEHVDGNVGAKTSCMDVTRTKMQLPGWSPSMGLGEGIVRLIDWYKEQAE